MGRFGAGDLSHYGGSGGTGFFSLRGDGDVAQVRFLYDSIEDVEGYAVHEVEVDGRKRYVNCLRSYNEPVDNCPFCREGHRQLVKLFVPVYSVSEKRTLIWERGKQFFAKISSLCGRYQHLVSHVFEIERNGKPGDTQTTYEIFPIEPFEGDGSTLDDFEPLDLSGFVLEKSAEDMEYYLQESQFPPTDDDMPVRRGRRADAEEEIESDNENVGRRAPSRTEPARGRVQRRTPAGRGGESF